MLKNQCGAPRSILFVVTGWKEDIINDRIRSCPDKNKDDFNSHPPCFGIIILSIEINTHSYFK